MDFSSIYYDIRVAVWRFIIDKGIHSLPIQMINIAKSIGVPVISYKRGTSLIRLIGLPKGDHVTDGFSFLLDEEWFILYDDSLPHTQIKFIIAHELGHILLGHRMRAKRTLFCRARFFSFKPKIETEADNFAFELLASVCVLAALHCTDPEDIVRLTGIPYPAAEIRARQLELMFPTNMIGRHSLERKVLAQFQPFIDEVKGKK